jgi:hypothetical protein
MSRIRAVLLVLTGLATVAGCGGGENWKVIATARSNKAREADVHGEADKPRQMAIRVEATRNGEVLIVWSFFCGEGFGSSSPRLATAFARTPLLRVIKLPGSHSTSRCTVDVNAHPTDSVSRQGRTLPKATGITLQLLTR